MHKTLEVEVITQGGVIWSGEAQSLIAPAVDGYFGVLPNHAPMVVELGIGDLRVHRATGWSHFALGGGILRVLDGRATVMADAVEPATDIDLARARASRARAEQRLAEAKRDPQIDASRAEASLVRALNRLRVAERPPSG